MTQLMLLEDVAESHRLGPLSGEIRAGEILHLVGPNGAGKSTLLARMAGLTTGPGRVYSAGSVLESWSATKLALHRATLPSNKIHLLQCLSGIFYLYISQIRHALTYSPKWLNR